MLWLRIGKSEVKTSFSAGVADAWRVEGQLQRSLNEIQKLVPTSEEIEEYDENTGDGVVTYMRNAGYYSRCLPDA